MQEYLPPDTVVHRVGGGTPANLRLKPKEMSLEPPGISVFCGGTAEDAAEQVRLVFPHATRLLSAAQTIGTTVVAAVRQAGFDVIADPTRHFDNHARLIHPEGVTGFSEENVERLSTAFRNTTVE